MRAISLSKFEKGIVNEDAVIAKKELIAVSDGAGGGGVFAERWSKYLVNHLLLLFQLNKDLLYIFFQQEFHFYKINMNKYRTDIYYYHKGLNHNKQAHHNIFY